jgi:hypothetical protein
MYVCILGIKRRGKFVAAKKERKADPNPLNIIPNGIS